MKALESKTVLSLGAIMAFRMLGLFMILPVFAAYVNKVPGATPTLIGVALGIYGLTQACLQIPFGAWSDKIGRKPVILLGLILFGIGSIVAALSHSIMGIIIGRALQGGGAVGSTVLALVADLTRDEHRSKAMAFVGLTIGMAFSVAMILGPLVNAHYQLAGIFWLTAIFALVGIILLYTVVPAAPKVYIDDAVEVRSNRFKAVLHNKHLLQLDFSILVQHAILTAIFIAIPILLTHDMHLSATSQTWMYLIVLGLAFIAMLPFIIIAEKKRKMKSIFTGCIAALLISQILLYFFQGSAWMVGITLFIFFTAFTILEASLPSLISKVAPIRNKGTAMGVYSSSQFFGIFVGGCLGGVILGRFGISGLFVFAGALSLIWLIVSFRIPEPPYLSTLIFTFTENETFSDDKLQTLLQQPGVAEAAWMKGESLVYVKIDKQKTSQAEVAKSLGKE